MHYTLAGLGPTVNTPPSLVETSFTLIQNTAHFWFLDYVDAEGDKVRFYKTAVATNGYANITEDGLLYYSSDVKFEGIDIITIQLTEYGLPPSFTAHAVQENITINVTGVNDPPDIYIAYKNDIYSAENASALQISLESKSKGGLVAYLIVTDLDEDDAFTWHTHLLADTEALLYNETIRVEDDEEIHTSLAKRNIKAAEVRSVNLSFNRTQNGTMQLNVIVNDKGNYYTDVMQVNMYILANPCVNGRCYGGEDDPQCVSVKRASGFQGYGCSCDHGYEDAHCDRLGFWYTAGGIALIVLMCIAGVVLAASLVYAGRNYVMKHNK